MPGTRFYFTFKKDTNRGLKGAFWLADLVIPPKGTDANPDKFIRSVVHQRHGE